MKLILLNWSYLCYLQRTILFIYSLAIYTEQNKYYLLSFSLFLCLSFSLSYPFSLSSPLLSDYMGSCGKLRSCSAQHLGLQSQGSDWGSLLVLRPPFHNPCSVHAACKTSEGCQVLHSWVSRSSLESLLTQLSLRNSCPHLIRTDSPVPISVQDRN